MAIMKTFQPNIPLRHVTPFFRYQFVKSNVKEIHVNSDKYFRLKFCNLTFELCLLVFTVKCREGINNEYVPYHVQKERLNFSNPIIYIHISNN